MKGLASPLEDMLAANELSVVICRHWGALTKPEWSHKYEITAVRVGSGDFIVRKAAQV
jgi:hypothetical protein